MRSSSIRRRSGLIAVAARKLFPRDRAALMHEYRPIQAFSRLAAGGFVCDQTRRDDSARFCGR